jgi:hypothetical protein
MGATPDAGVKVSVTNLMDKLGISGRGTANDRLRDAEERGFLKLVETAAEYGRTSARVYKIGRSSEEIAKDFATRETLGVFPLPDEVRLQVQTSGKNQTACTSRAVPPVTRPASAPSGHEHHEGALSDRAAMSRAWTRADARPA